MLQRSVSIDYLKCLLAVGVVLGHSILIHAKLVEWSFLTGMGLLRSLVPAFSVVSGYCFFVTYNRGKALKWLSGLVVAYLFWTVFYAPIWVEPDTTWRDVAYVFVWGTMHLWYIAGLIVAAILIIAFASLGERTGTGLWPMMISASVLAGIGSVLAFLAFYRDWQLPLEFSRNGFTVIFPFAAIGYALASWVARNGRDSLPRLGVIWLVVAVLFGLRLGEALFSMRTYGLSLAAMPEIPFLALPAPVFLFLGFLRMDLPELPVNLSGWSSSIYFLHIFFILAVHRFLGIDSIPVFLLVGVVVPIILAQVMERLRPHLARLLRTGKRSVGDRGLREGSA